VIELSGGVKFVQFEIDGKIARLKVDASVAEYHLDDDYAQALVDFFLACADEITREVKRS
jgi:hypothetical protein